MEKECFVHFRDGISVETQQSVENKYRLTEIRSFLLTRARLYAIGEGNASTVIPHLRREPSVKFADHNRRHSLQSISLNEPRLNDQWYLKNRGQTVNNQSGQSGADVGWVSALDQYNPRKKRVVVSVIDTGISADHPELTDQLAYMPAEVSGTDGIDDDGLGFIDDKYGWDFIDNDNDPADLNGHGTQVAGIIAAHSGNRVGMSGVAPNAVILPMRVFNEYGGGATDDRVLSALGYSISGGVRIINLSLGKGSAFSYPIQDALYNLERDYDVLMVCAAGNGDYYGRGMNLDQSAFYPASYLGNAILSVASTDQNNELSPFPTMERPPSTSPLPDRTCSYRTSPANDPILKTSNGGSQDGPSPEAPIRWASPGKHLMMTAVIAGSPTALTIQVGVCFIIP